MPTFDTLAAQTNTSLPIMLFDITSIEDGEELHLSQMPISFGGNVYEPIVQGVAGFEVSLENSPLGIMAIPDISLTLGDASGAIEERPGISGRRGWRAVTIRRSSVRRPVHD